MKISLILIAAVLIFVIRDLYKKGHLRKKEDLILFGLSAALVELILAVGY